MAEGRRHSRGRSQGQLIPTLFRPLDINVFVHKIINGLVFGTYPCAGIRGHTTGIPSCASMTGYSADEGEPNGVHEGLPEIIRNAYSFLNKIEVHILVRWLVARLESLGQNGKTTSTVLKL